MPIKASKLRESKSTVVVSYQDDEAKVTYREGIVNPGWLDRTAYTAVRIMLSEILLDWDVEDNGQRLVPGSVDLQDPVWRERIYSRRVAEAMIEANKTVPPEELSADDLEKLRQGDFTEAEIKSAIELAWIEIMGDLPQSFILAVYQAILEDIQPGPKAKRASGAT